MGTNLEEHTITVLIDGQEMPEHLVAKVITNFVNEKVADIAIKLENEMVSVAESLLDDLHTEEYRRWLDEHAVTFLNAMRVEKLEGLSEHLTSMFLENFCVCPVRKIDVAVALKEENKRLKEQTASDEKMIQTVVEFHENAAKSELFEEIRKECGLTLMDKSRLISFMEGVAFTDRDAFKAKALQMVETHFTKKKVKSADVLSEVFEGNTGKPKKFESPLVEAASRALG